jgi:lipid A 4'-phosphatase
MNTNAEFATHARTPALFWWVLVASIAFALVPTIWTSIDLQTAQLFAGTSPSIASANWWWVEWINQYVPAAFRAGLVVALVAWISSSIRKSAVRLRVAMGVVVIAGILGPGAVVNWGFKEHWQRARPYQVENFGGDKQFTRATVMTDQCDNNCSFVSGHVACGFFFTALMLIHRRRKVMWAIAGSVAGLVIGFARMSDMAHWLSDVLWAYPITLATSWIVWKSLLWVYTRPRSTVG